MKEIILPKRFIKEWYEEKYSKQLEHSYYGEPDKEIKELALKLEKNKDRVLDVGCGDGRYLIEFAKQGFGTIGVDFSEAAKKSANRRAIKEGVSNLVQIINTDINRYDFGNEKFDIVTCSEVLQQLNRKDVRKIIEKMQKATREKGYNFIRLPTNIERILPNGDTFWYEDEARFSVYVGWINKIIPIGNLIFLARIIFFS